MSNNVIILSDRIKELSYTMGTGNLSLSGSVGGFSSFGSVYQHNDSLFYAVTDGVNYEIGSGIYRSASYDLTDGITTNELKRFPVRSSNNNGLVNFGEGTKEVYVTYPATHAVYTGSGISGHNTPQTNGLAFWASPNVLNYNSNLVVDPTNSRIGIRSSNPQYAIDIGGAGSQSIVRSSGIVIGKSGVYFPPQNNNDSSYVGGRQLTHFEPNQLDKYAYDNSLIGQLTGSNAILQLSGVVNQFILLKQQNAGTVFAGPPSGCTPPCSPAYPSFRILTLEDIPNLSSIYVTNTLLTSASGSLNNKINSVSGVLRNDLILASSASGILNTKINDVSGVLKQITLDSSGILRANDVAISGYFQNKTQNIIVYSPAITQLSGIVGINYTPRSDCSLSVLRNENNQNSYGTIIDSRSNITASGSFASVGSYTIANALVSSGIVNSGVSCGSQVLNLRNIYTDDSGSLSGLYGMTISYGHSDSRAQNPITDVAMGLNINAYATSGTIRAAYDLVLGGSGTNATYHWGIYQTTPYDNFLLGNLGLGTINPTKKLDIVGDSIRLRSSKTPTSGNAPGNAGDICWDSKFMYVCTSTNKWQKTPINQWTTTRTINNSADAGDVGEIFVNDQYLYAYTPSSGWRRVALGNSFAPLVGDYNPPSVPTNLIATPANGKVNLSWTPPNGGLNIIDYIVQYSGANAGNFSTFDGQDPNPFAVITGLTNGTLYTFKVAAVDAITNGNYSSTVTATPASTVPGFTTINSISSPSINTIQLSPYTLDNGGASLTGYKVEFTKTGGSSFEKNFSYSNSLTLTGADGVSGNFTDLPNGTTYTVRAAALSSVGSGPYSSTSTVLVKALGLPSAPTNLALSSVQADTATFSWTAPSDAGGVGGSISGYYLYYKTGSITILPFPNVNTPFTNYVVVNGNTTTGSVSGLNTNTDYSFKVHAFTNAGSGIASNVLTLITADLPSAPLNLTASALNNTSVQLSWDTPTSNGGSALTDYVVQYKLSSQGDGSYVTFSDGVSTTRTATLTGLSTNNYVFRVAAKNVYGTGSYSTPRSFSLTSPFISTWRTTNTSSGSSGSYQISLPLKIDGTYNFTVDWGDGTTETITSYSQRTHNYSTVFRNYVEIRITGTIIGWEFNGTGDKLKLLTISNWGPLNLSTSNGCFAGCANLSTIDATDSPVLPTDCSSFFEGCSTLLGQNLSSLNVSNVTKMSYMFNNCKDFVGEISAWNVSNVTNMTNMFNNAAAFNADITSWNVGNVTNMSSMFSGASSFNRNISSWDTSKVTNMASMFSGATAFNQNVASLNISLVTNMSKIFYLSGMNQTNYHNLLIAWGNSGKSSQSNVTFTIDSEFDSTNSSAVAGRNYLINTKNWSMVDWGDQNTAILTFTITNSGDGLPLRGMIYNLSDVVLEINWGDGTGSVYNSSTASNATHAYSSGNYDVRIRVRTGNYFTFSLYNIDQYYCAFLRDIKRCGNKFKLADTGYHFRYSNLGLYNGVRIPITASDIPILPEGNSLLGCFLDCNELTLWPALSSSLNTSSITDMSFMFYGTRFAGPVYNWNFSNVTNMKFFLYTLFTTYPTQFYNNLLRNLSDNASQNNVQLYVRGNYSNTSSVVAARNTMLSRGWTISDLGATS
jgi:surface protein